MLPIVMSSSDPTSAFTALPRTYIQYVHGMCAASVVCTPITLLH